MPVFIYYASVRRSRVSKGKGKIMDPPSDVESDSSSASLMYPCVYPPLHLTSCSLFDSVAKSDTPDVPTVAKQVVAPAFSDIDHSDGETASRPTNEDIEEHVILSELEGRNISAIHDEEQIMDPKFQDPSLRKHNLYANLPVLK
jgi:hypothetical protein